MMAVSVVEKQLDFSRDLDCRKLLWQRCAFFTFFLPDLLEMKSIERLGLG